MLVSLNWLNDFVDIKDIDIENFAEKMTMSGTNVEEIRELGEGISKVVVGKILTIEKHSNADKLMVTKVDVGTEVVQIVTGADNIKVGDYIPIALIGARLKDFKIRKSKLRGVESQGMMCSAEELGMDTSLLHKEDLGGIYILKQAFEPGEDVMPILGLDDKIVEFELTANRSDCLSILGIAREASATFNRHLTLPIIEVEETEDSIDDYLSISIEDEEACPRYVARMIKVNKIEPAPQWMQKRLLNCGVRPINNIVDATNYVMLEMGQPLHAFDYDKLGSKEILVRRANKGENITTLDGVKRALDEEMVVITNGEEPVAIAGVMGGENSDIWNDTQIVVIESANFDKKAVRQTGRKLGLHSEAANRFEKGVDFEIAAKAADRVAQLLVDIGAGEVYRGRIDVYPKQTLEKVIEIDGDWVNQFIGIDIPVIEMQEYLERLFLDVDVIGSNLTITVPSYRQDLEIKEDIAEEIARMYGYDNIPSTIMSGIVTKGGLTRAQYLENKIKTLLISKGFYEILTTSFTGPSNLLALNISEDDELFKAVKLRNPLGEENSVMRTTLLPGMLQVISHNYNRNIPRGMFYEIAVNYRKISNFEDNLPIEEKHLCLGMYGKQDFFKLKGYIEVLLEMLRIENVEYNKIENTIFHPGRSGEILVNEKKVGVLGELHPNVVENYDLPERTYVCELNLVSLLDHAQDNIVYTELPKYPAVTRDIALIVDQKITAKEIEDIIISNGKGLLEEFKLFDVYQGEQISEGQKSIAYSLIFRSKERTLTDNEINKIFDSMVREAEEKLRAKLRD